MSVDIWAGTAEKRNDKMQLNIRYRQLAKACKMWERAYYNYLDNFQDDALTESPTIQHFQLLQELSIEESNRF